MRAFVALPCLLFACTTTIEFDDVNIEGEGQVGVGDDDDNGTTATDHEGTDPDAPSGVVEITGMSVTCDGDFYALFEVDALGVTSETAIFMQETANAPPNWTENHTLESVDVAADGSWEILERRLADGSTLGGLEDWIPDVNSLFDCEIHLSDSRVMTFAIAAWDADGKLADCVVFGEDPEAMIDGTLERYNEPDFDLAPCRIVAF